MAEKQTEDLLKLDKTWWSIRAWVIAHDKSKYVGPVSIERRLRLRKN